MALALASQTEAPRDRGRRPRVKEKDTAALLEETMENIFGPDGQPPVDTDNFRQAIALVNGPEGGQSVTHQVRAAVSKLLLKEDHRVPAEGARSETYDSKRYFSALRWCLDSVERVLSSGDEPHLHRIRLSKALFTLWVLLEDSLEKNRNNRIADFSQGINQKLTCIYQKSPLWIEAIRGIIPWVTVGYLLSEERLTLLRIMTHKLRALMPPKIL
ncbi:MAG: hypothetical protein Q8P45_02275 [Candidatus Harrisonbacteria bacterium]|nr:hypothetical protein [Candidatus Harrisonbacteria bacterium]